jgi:signal transduction histidine kinase
MLCLNHNRKKRELDVPRGLFLWPRITVYRSPYHFLCLWLRIPEWYYDDRIVNNLIVFTVGLIFAITMAHTVVSEKVSRARAEQLLAELEKSHQRLKTYAAQVAELATTKERNRLARDMHDSLGHFALYRAVQEGLTNVQKHAKASAVHLDVQFAEHETTICLRDNGNGFDVSLLQALQPERDGQYGLQGLQERLELVGGRLRVESVPGQGTQLFVAIPKNLLPAHSTLAFPAH